MAKIDAKGIGIAILFSYLAVLLLAYMASQIGLPTFKAGYGILIIAISVGISLVMTASFDKKISGLEVWYFILVMGSLIGSFFLLKTYVPELFSAIPDPIKEVFSGINSFILIKLGGKKKW